MVAITVLSEPLITETLLEPLSATKMSLFEGSETIASGAAPTSTVVITAPVEPLITETLSEPSFVT